MVKHTHVKSLLFICVLISIQSPRDSRHLRQLTLVWETSVQILVSTISFSVFGSETEKHYHTIHFYFFIFLVIFLRIGVRTHREKKNVNIMIIELLSMCTLMDQTRAIYVVLGVAYIQTSTLKSHKMKSVRILRLI